jgi:hypothetical protein
MDLELLLNCPEEDLQQHTFFKNSESLMGIIDSTIMAIDSRMGQKRLSTGLHTHFGK